MNRSIITRLPSVRCWFGDEIEATIAAVNDANLDIAGAIDTPEMRMYRRGFDAALRAMSKAFQVDAPATSRATLTRRVQP